MTQNQEFKVGQKVDFIRWIGESPGATLVPLGSATVTEIDGLTLTFDKLPPGVDLNTRLFVQPELLN